MAFPNEAIAACFATSSRGYSWIEPNLQVIEESDLVRWQRRTSPWLNRNWNRNQNSQDAWFDVVAAFTQFCDSTF
jgi:hypothetical protein